MLLDDVLKTVRLPYGDLTPKQREVIVSNVDKPRLLLATEVGTGKTSLATLLMLCRELPKIIITCPPILQRAWSRWLTTIGETDNAIYAGPKRGPEQFNAKWVILSHAIFRNDFQKLQQRFLREEFGLIVDEAHGLKNPQSVLFKRVHAFIGADHPTLLLTATPTTKHEDTYAYMKIKTPLLYRSYGHWKNLHVGSEDIWGAITKYENLDMLRDNFAKNTVKLTKKEVFGEMPDPIFDPIEYELDPKHLKLYNKLAEEQLLLLTDGSKIDGTTAQKLNHLLQQIIVNYEKFTGDEKDRSLSYDLLDQMTEQVDPINGPSKFVVWTWYTYTTEKVFEYLKNKYGEKHVVVAYGKSNSQKAVDRIMLDDTARVMVAHPLSVGAGLDLQFVCNQMLMLEYATVPAYIRQAIGRVDRYGGTLGVPTIHFGIAKGTVQQGMYNRLLSNDESVSFIERNVSTLRDMIYGRK